MHNDRAIEQWGSEIVVMLYITDVRLRKIVQSASIMEGNSLPIRERPDDDEGE